MAAYLGPLTLTGSRLLHFNPHFCKGKLVITIDFHHTDKTGISGVIASLDWSEKGQQAIHLLPKDAYKISYVTT